MNSAFSFSAKKHLPLALAFLALVMPMMIDIPGLEPAGQRVFGIFLMAIILWVSEAIPLHATAALIIFLQILLVSDKALFSLPDSFTPPKYSAFYAALANPTIMLFLGGFFLADGAAKFNLDRNLARVLLKPFGKSPSMIVLGIMLITALLSMFMSNTATTATMMAFILPVIAGLPTGDKLKISLALCVPFAANIGGIGTPVGTPPNAIALGAISEQGLQISFLQWMGLALPFALIVLLIAWQLLLRLFPSSQKEVDLNIQSTFETSKPAVLFYVTAGLTVLLWLTEPLHGMKSSIVGFLPVVLLLATSVFGIKDLQNIQWHVLWLVAGGIALGKGVSTSGLDAWLIGLVKWGAIPAILLAFTLALLALVMSTVISNSATANLLVPIGISLASSGAVEIPALQAAFFIAVGASLAMALPISTPPNAIAYSTGAIETKHMVLAGSIVGAVGVLLFVFVAPQVWSLLNLVP